jgi:hypothetical protein
MVLVQLAGAAAEAYTTALLVHPVATKAATAAVVATAGDALAQIADTSTDAYDPARGQCFAMFGALYTGAWQHHLFGWLQTHVTGMVLPSSVERVLLNQFVAIPFLYTPLFFVVCCFTSGLSPRAGLLLAKSRVRQMLLVNWQFWLPVQTLVFHFLSPQFFVPATCLASLIWNIILSTLIHREAVPHEEAVPIEASRGSGATFSMPSVIIR